LFFFVLHAAKCMDNEAAASAPTPCALIYAIAGSEPNDSNLLTARAMRYHQIEIMANHFNSRAIWHGRADPVYYSSFAKLLVDRVPHHHSIESNCHPPVTSSVITASLRMPVLPETKPPQILGAKDVQCTCARGEGFFPTSPPGRWHASPAALPPFRHNRWPLQPPGSGILTATPSSSSACLKVVHSEVGRRFWQSLTPSCAPCQLTTTPPSHARGYQTYKEGVRPGRV